MASLGVLGRTFMASSSGFLVDWMDGNWAAFFILTALMVIPSLLFLRYIRDDIHRLEQR
jgi:PAT family beta-lactamase induction signal transducer AmpG